MLVRCSLLVLGASCLVLMACASDDPIVFPGHSVQRKQANRRPGYKATPCPECGVSARKRQTARDPGTTTVQPPKEKSDEDGIPMDFLMRLNEIDDEMEFFALIGGNNKELVNTSGLFEDDFDPGSFQVRNHRANTDETFAIRIGNPDVELDEDIPMPHLETSGRATKLFIERPKQARCMPENTTVPLKQENSTEDPFVIYFPSCTRVQRCGGCCNSDLLSCQPTEIRLRSFQVITTEFKNGKFDDIRKSKLVHIEEHLKCNCDCKIKSEHCNSLQKYDERACRCKCINNDDKLKCDAENKIKLWDSDSCLCKCREVSECSTGFYFDEQTCSCKSDTLIYSRYQSQPRQPGSNYQHHPTPWEQVTGRRTP